MFGRRKIFGMIGAFLGLEVASKAAIVPSAPLAPTFPEDELYLFDPYRVRVEDLTLGNNPLPKNAIAVPSLGLGDYGRPSIVKVKAAGREEFVRLSEENAALNLKLARWIQMFGDDPMEHWESLPDSHKYSQGVCVCSLG